MARILTFALLLLCVIALYSCSGDSSKRAAGDRVVAKVEQFRRQNGRLPNSLAEVGVKETEQGPIYYEKKNDSRYVVWYGTTLGESMTYDSDVKRWEAHN